MANQISQGIENLQQQNLKWKFKVNDKARRHLWVIGSHKVSSLKKLFKDQLPDWQLDELLSFEKEEIVFSNEEGQHWVLLHKKEKSKYFVPKSLKDSDYGFYRDLVGAWFARHKSDVDKGLQIHWVGLDNQKAMGAWLGAQLGVYRYKESFKKSKAKEVSMKCYSCKCTPKIMAEADHRALGVNLGRHLVNIPPGDLNPDNYSSQLKKMFTKQKSFSVKIHTTSQLKQGGFGLISGVGQGAVSGPCIVHLKYRPTGSSKKKPIALIGKGITFDTGGVNLKPANFMRLMKKDMGGSAAIAGIAQWAALTQPKVPIDFYFAIAENAISHEAFRPSDVLTARNGMTVEIHNTDAEGRLVLADAMCLALEAKGKDEPSQIIDVATLTGAVKVGLGITCAGLFSNNESLQNKIQNSAQASEDPVWAMPLDQKQRARLNSPFADLQNCTDGYGGSVTAALFLESFVDGKPWAHLDIYGWNNSSAGALGEQGGSGQGVQCLIDYLSRC